MGTTELFVELIVIGIGAFTRLIYSSNEYLVNLMFIWVNLLTVFFPFLAGSPGTNFKIRNTGN